MPDELSHDEWRDREWRSLGEELEWGAEFTVEWGVQFSRPSGSHVTVYGDGSNEQAAREFVAQHPRREEGLSVSVVARRVLTGPWGERVG